MRPKRNDTLDGVAAVAVGAVVGQNRIDLDSAGAILRQGIDRIVDHHIDLPSHQILHRRRGAPIGHELKAGAGEAL